jgi:hypothetical protein
MRHAAWLAFLVIAAGCSMHSASPTYTLYRNSPVDPTARLHWATFDASDQGTGMTNKANCEAAAALLNAKLSEAAGEAQPDRFWCEKGRFRP